MALLSLASVFHWPSIVGRMLARGAQGMWCLEVHFLSTEQGGKWIQRGKWEYPA